MMSLLRKLTGASPGTSPGTSTVRHAMEAYAFFQGTLHLAGSVTAMDGEITRVALVLPDGSAHPLTRRALGVPDGPHAFRFDERLSLPVAIGEVVRARLQVALRGRGDASVGNLGGVDGDPAHRLVARFIDTLQGSPPGDLLEIGSRARSGITRRDHAPAHWGYCGMDIMEGPNVDVVADAHQLSRVFPERRFDAVMAFSVLEHLLMPWKFVIELNRVLTPGALGIFTTHQSWPLHDQPWDFWRFSDTAWTGLLNAATGFEVLDAQMGEPCHFVAARCHAAVAFGEEPQGRLASFVLFRKTGETRLDWPVDLQDITGTAYPTAVTDIRAPRL